MRRFGMWSNTIYGRWGEGEGGGEEKETVLPLIQYEIIAVNDRFSGVVAEYSVKERAESCDKNGDLRIISFLLFFKKLEYSTARFGVF